MRTTHRQTACRRSAAERKGRTRTVARRRRLADRAWLRKRSDGARAGASRGFSLIELMVVLVILGLLTGLVGPRLFGRVESSKVKTAETQVKLLKGALQTYRLDVGQYPNTAQGLAALMAPPPEVADYWDGPYLEEELPMDPWRTPYVYQFPANNLQGFALYSLGADSTEGGEGINAEVGYLSDE